MGNIYKSIDRLVGKTPLLEAKNIEKAENLSARLLVKLECFNPTGSAKDRAALYMIEEAEKSGKLKPGSTIIEPTSGNTGIGLAAIGTARGYEVVIVMPDSMSEERKMLMRAYGAVLMQTYGSLGMKGAIDKANELAKTIPDSFIPDQFTNQANAKAHYETTGPEIYDDTDGEVDIFVAGVGTGGTITGVGRYLKEKNPNVQIVAVEPADSPLLSGGNSGPHGIQGIGANFIPDLLDRSVYDRVMTATTDESYEAARLFAAKEGVLVGISSGAALASAIKLARLPENAGKTIVALLPDTGSRYLSTPLFI
ncbi:MAG: cysteine synthase A [Clostridia bacterium]|nr:cysteine synthase A [Clostridia bacterium]MBR3805968.1 cysteine synthase A [Clostridia bacterium]